MGDLTGVLLFLRTTSFGIIDKYNENTDISLIDARQTYVKSIEIIINGQTEKMIDNQSNEALAAKPVKRVTKHGMYLSIGYNLLAGHFTLKQQGHDAEKLPPVK